MNAFTTTVEAQLTATHRLWIYNNERPSRALGRITPAMKFVEAIKLKPLLQAFVRNVGITFGYPAQIHYSLIFSKYLL